MADEQQDDLGLRGRAARRTRSSAPKVQHPARVVFDADTGRFTGIGDEDIARWSAAFPGVNVKAEILKSEDWLRQHRSRAPKSATRFLTNWLGRAQGDIGSSNGHTASAAADDPYADFPRVEACPSACGEKYHLFKPGEPRICPEPERERAGRERERTSRGAV